MPRIILILLLFSALVIAAASVRAYLAAGQRDRPGPPGGVPDMTTRTLRNIAFALLFLLQLGVVTGLLGGGG